MKKNAMILAAMVAVCGALIVLATDNVTGLVRVEANITHSATNTANTITETIANFYKWGGGGSIGSAGTASGMTKLWSKRTTIAGGGTNSYDLAGGITNSFGVALTFTKVKLFAVTCTNSMTNAAQSILVRPAHVNGWQSWMTGTTDAVRVYSGGSFSLMAPATNAYTVTATTGDIFDLVNESTNAVQIDVLAGGD